MTDVLTAARAQPRAPAAPGAPGAAATGRRWSGSSGSSACRPRSPRTPTSGSGRAWRDFDPNELSGLLGGPTVWCAPWVMRATIHLVTVADCLGLLRPFDAAGARRRAGPPASQLRLSISPASTFFVPAFLASPLPLLEASRTLTYPLRPLAFRRPVPDLDAARRGLCPAATCCRSCRSAPEGCGVFSLRATVRSQGPPPRGRPLDGWHVRRSTRWCCRYLGAFGPGRAGGRRGDVVPVDRACASGRRAAPARARSPSATNGGRELFDLTRAPPARRRVPRAGSLPGRCTTTCCSPTPIARACRPGSGRGCPCRAAAGSAR